MARELIEWMDYQNKKSILTEEEFLASLAVIYRGHNKKHKAIIRELYEKYSNNEGKLVKAELFKYNRSTNIKQQLADLYKETGIQEWKTFEQSLKGELTEHQARFLYTLAVIQPDLKTSRDLMTEQQLKSVMNQRYLDETAKQTLMRNKGEQAVSSFNGVLVAASSQKTMTQVLKETDKTTQTSVRKTMLVFQTELTHKKNVINHIVFDRYELEEVQFIATLDNRTSEQCREHDHKVFKRENAPIPPLHPRCRSQLVAYFPQSLLRRARNPETGGNYLTDDVDYQTWRNSII